MTQTETSLTIARVFQTSASKLFEAWSQPDQMVKWMGPGEVYCKDVKIDLKVGGKYRIHMFGPDHDGEKKDHIAVGEYTGIVPGEKIQFSWSWESGTVVGSSVIVTFKDVDGQAELTLAHEKFPSSEAAQMHHQGWNGCLDKLENFVK